jgi:hypothetical protein
MTGIDLVTYALVSVFLAGLIGGYALGKTVERLR